ncbi:MAG: hypothetical protein ACTS73_06585 [Arsenophonus sp. NEOnobi-MAG3]
MRSKMLIESQKRTGPNFSMAYKRRGFNRTPRLARGDAALGFWNAMAKIFPYTQHQRY